MYLGRVLKKQKQKRKRMFLNLIVKTFIDSLPVLLSCVAVMLVVALIVYVGTQDSRPQKKVARKSWDLVRPTRFMSLE